MAEKSRGGRRRQRQSSDAAGETKQVSVAGVITVHPRGFAFVIQEEGKDIFIPPSGLGTALSDDRVLVRIESEDRRGPVGRVEKIITRGHTEIIGVLTFDPESDSASVRPLRRDLAEKIPLLPLSTTPGGGTTDAPEEGDWIAATLLFPSASGQSLRASFDRLIAKPGTIAADLDAIAAEFSLPAPWSTAVNRRVARLTAAPIKRERLEAATDVVTIDPEDAKDFDDAISLHPGPNSESMVVGVHIADVAAYVKPASSLDREAAQRGFTSYLPGRTLHMLPPALAARKCSLREGVEGLAHSLFLTIECSSGKVVDSRRCHTLVTVTRRLTFEQVQALIDGDSPPGIPESVAATVLSLHHLAGTMRRRRLKTEQFLALDSREVRVLCDEESVRITGLKRFTGSGADHLVEEFMLAANTAVARELRKRRLAGLYRIHAEPNPADLEEFFNWSRELGVSAGGRLDSRKKINSFLQRVSERNDAEIINSMFLRILSRAAYSAEPGLHYGLGKRLYCHFTSPIRRYPDLLVHQQLWAADQGNRGRDVETCGRLAGACNLLEKNNDDAYFAASDRLKIRYIQELRLQGQRLFYEGIVFRVTGEGLSVFLPDLGLFALLPKSSVPRKSGGKVWKSGNVVYVTVNKANPVRGQLLVVPAGS